MNLPVAINKLSAQMGLTSRTLRHWESEGLFKSLRDSDSGWRVYDEDAILCINITTLFRKLGIPLKDIKNIIYSRTFEKAEEAIKKQLILLEQNNNETNKRRNSLLCILDSIAKCGDQQVDANSLKTLNNVINSLTEQIYNKKMEDFIMSDNKMPHINVRIISLPPMRTAYNTAVGTAPEDEAMAPVLEWLETNNLMGTARLFGGNVNPLPGTLNPEYGYGMCASIPDGISIPSHLKEIRLPGGLYAMMPSSDNIYGSWQLLMKYLAQSDEYAPDRTRLCFEEHIRNDNPAGQGNQFILNLLEPVKRK